MIFFVIFCCFFIYKINYDEYITLNAKDSAYPTHASSHNQSEGNITPL